MKGVVFMKRLFSVLMLAALLCALALPAAADVAYMPRDNFLEKHWEDCRHENRQYWTNGAEGYVLAHSTPGSADATPLPNGGLYYISNVYKDEWGVLEYDRDTLENKLWNDSVSGWVKMSDMVMDYDSAAFEADHAAELTEESAELQLAYSDVAYGYKYPGSGIVTEEFSGQNYRDPFRLAPLFKDPAGRTWGFVGYYYGRHNCWICLDDPCSDALPPDENAVTVVIAASALPTPAAPTEMPAETSEPAEAPAPPPASAGKTVELTPAADDATLQQAAKDNRGSGPYIAAGAGGVVVIAAAVLTAALRKKRK